MELSANISYEALHGAPPACEPERQQYFMEKAKKQLEVFKDRLGRPLTCCINTFGCQMNARDSEKLLGILEAIGYVASDTEEADFVLYNTCTVRENANLRVYGRLGQLGARKKKHPHMMIALCGCMMQEKEVVEKIRKSYRYVDLIFGTHNIFKLAELISICLEKRQEELLNEEEGVHTKHTMVVDVWKDTDMIVEDLPVERKYSFKSGVNIMFGCNNFCSYCIVPYVRGRERSRKPEEIIKEIKRLVADGVVEVMLLGQNVNSYGKNLETPMTFAELLREIEKIPGLERIRFMTSHPKDLSDELIQGISLTTDIIVGFPGETEEDLEETLDVVRNVRFDSAFTFIYSKRTGTPAAAMENQVPEDVVKERFDRLLKEVQDISAEVCGRDVHTVQQVLVEEVNDHSPELMTGRMSNNTVVHFPGDASMIGSLVDVYLEESRGFYYMGRIQGRRDRGD